MADLLNKLTDAVRTGAVGRETRRSAQWFRDKIRGLRGELRNRFSSTNPDKFYREAEEKVNPNVMKRRANLGDVFCYLSGSADSLQACREHNNWPVIIK